MTHTAYKGDILLSVPGEQRQIEDNGQPIAIDNKEEGQEGVNGSFRDDVGVETIAEFDGVKVVTKVNQSINQVRTYRPVFVTFFRYADRLTYHSKSLYIMVKKTWRKRLTALIKTANR